jgi:hypothetical protein
MPRVSSWEDAQNRYVPEQLRARGWLVNNVAQQRPNNAAFDLKIARPDGSIGPWEVNVADRPIYRGSSRRRWTKCWRRSGWMNSSAPPTRRSKCRLVV